MITLVNQNWWQNVAQQRMANLRSLNREFTRGTGWTTTAIYEGTEADLIGLQAELINLWDTVRIYRDGDSPVWILEATMQGDPERPPDDEDIEDTHELQSSILHQPTRINPITVAAVLATSGATITAVEAMQVLMKMVEDYRFNRDKKDPSDYLTEIENNNNLNTTNAKTFFNDQIAERTTYMRPVYVYRRTRKVNPLNSAFTINQAYDGVNKIWTHNQIVGAEFLPSAPLHFTIPPGDYLKLAPTLVAAVNQRIHVTWEYWYSDAWSELYYQRH